jgi:hypothetical protein
MKVAEPPLWWPSLWAMGVVRPLSRDKTQQFYFYFIFCQGVAAKGVAQPPFFFSFFPFYFLFFLINF